MNVSLIGHTPHALALLVFTKNTRLAMTEDSFDAYTREHEDELLKEWEYMQGTIQSSWEFVDFTFLIEDVTRAFTHQLVRHRVGTSFAQQSQRAVDMSGFAFKPLDNGNENHTMVFENAMESANLYYQALRALDVPPQDARGVLPTNIYTSIVFKANLRTLHDMCLKRLCVKTQGEFQDVMRHIRNLTIDALPWTEPVLRVGCAFTGVCEFPGVPVSDCPIKPHVFNPATGFAWEGHPEARPATKDEIQHLWATMPRTELVPLQRATP